MDVWAIKPIVDVTILHGERLLMVQFSTPPDRQAGWFLPNDVIREREHPDKAAARVLHEQIGLSIPAPQIFTVDSFQGNDGSWHLALHYLLKIDDAVAAEIRPSIAKIHWFDLAKLPAKAEVAHHGWYLDVVARNLRRMNSVSSTR
ncbi:MAG TPA: NUDIX domain-containing protein [Alphaproteobacteria bacterium]|nr:NUDIX domain-containing protein [Alphaproteobacteria bacterium]